MKTFTEALSVGPDRPGENGWRGRHNREVVGTTSIVLMLKGWYNYAAFHHTRFESLLGHDYVLGPQWEAIGDALLPVFSQLMPKSSVFPRFVAPPVR